MDALLIRKIADEVMRRIAKQREPVEETTQTLVLLASQIVGDQAAMDALRERFTGQLLFAGLGRAFDAPDAKTVFLEEQEIKKLLATAAESDDVVLLAPGINQLENIAYGREGGAAEEVLLRSILWGKRVHMLLDFSPPRFKRGTFYEKIGDALDALTDMGVSVFTYTCIPVADRGAFTLVTENDIVQAYGDGKFKIRCVRDAIVTPAARDRAKELDIKIDWQG